VATAGTARAHEHAWTRRSKPSNLRFGLASETPVLDAAFRLVHEQYVWRGFMKAPNASGRRVNLRHALPSTRVFVARHGSRVVGTATLFEDSLLGVPMDDVFADQLATMRSRGRRIAEVSALAMDGDRRAYGLPVVMRLLRLVLLYAASVAELDDLCLVVRPQHAEFYKHLGTCRTLGEPRDYEKVNLDGAVALHIDLHEIRALIAAMQAGQVPANSVQAFIAGAAYRETVAQLADEAPAAALTAEQFEEFFGLGDVLAQASAWERAYVESLHARPFPRRRAIAAASAIEQELAAA
jgi:N-acyl amino acid synthase FeeM